MDTDQLQHLLVPVPQLGEHPSILFPAPRHLQNRYIVAASPLRTITSNTIRWVSSHSLLSQSPHHASCHVPEEEIAHRSSHHRSHHSTFQLVPNFVPKRCGKDIVSNRYS